MVETEKTEKIEPITIDAEQAVEKNDDASPNIFIDVMEKVFKKSGIFTTDAYMMGTAHLDLREVVVLDNCKTSDEFIKLFLKDKLGSNIENKLTLKVRKQCVIEYLISYLAQEGKFIVDKDHEQFNDSIYYMQDFKIINIYSEEFQRLYFCPEIYEIFGKENLLHRIAYQSKSFQRVNIWKCFHYSENDNCIYFSDRMSGYYRISEIDIKHLFNGEDNIYFKYQDGNEFIDVDDFLKKPLSLSDGLLDFYKIFNYNDNFLKKDENAYLLYAQTLACVFETIIREKPITVFCGEKGSGKTTLARYQCRFLISKYADVFKVGDKNEEELDILLTNTPFAVIDNKEKVSGFLQDSLAIASTSGKKMKRKLYTTNEFVEYKYNCFITITAINPQFKRPDIVDRMILIQLNRNEMFLDSRFFEPDDLKLKEFYAIFFLDLQAILRQLSNAPYSSEFRLASYFRVLNCALNILTSDAKEILDHLDKSLQDYLDEEGSLISIIETALDDINNTSIQNFNDRMSSEKLLSVFKTWGLVGEITARSLIAQLNNLKSDLLKKGIYFEKKIDSHNGRFYNISKKSVLKNNQTNL